MITTQTQQLDKIMNQNNQTEPALSPNWLNITPIEFERMLNLYGMNYNNK